MADINKNALVGKRLTWDELIDNFPAQWVGLIDVKYKNNDGATIESGVIKFADKDQLELIDLAIDGICISRYIPSRHDKPEVIVVECGVQ